MSSGGQNFSNNSNSCLSQTCWMEDPVSQSMFITAIFVLMVYSVPLNVWVLWLGSGSARRSSEVLTLHLATMELLSCFGFFLSMLLTFICSDILRSMYVCFSYIGFYGRVLLTGCICAERYLAVVHPVRYLSSNLSKFRSVSVGLTYVISLIYSLAHVSGIIPYQLYVLPFCVTLLITIFCSLTILNVLKKPIPGECDSNSMNQAKRSAYKIIILILVLTVVCYISHICLKVYRFSQHIYCVTNTVYIWVFILGFVPHPLLYLYKAGKLKCVRGL